MPAMYLLQIAFPFLLLFGFSLGGIFDKSIFDEITDFIFDKKCMGELGCFSNGPPFFDIQHRTISLLPEDRDAIGTSFYLYTRTKKNEASKMTNKNWDLKMFRESGFSASTRTIFVIPGFMSHYAPSWTEPMKDALLEVEDCNVFIVSWSGGNGPIYELSVANSRVVGAEIALFVSNLKKLLYVRPESVYLIGHSLGAQIAGYAGKRIKNLGRITGLDPAGPLFQNVDARVRLDATDAIFVDVIHSDVAQNRFKGFGTTESVGHLDFFPNGGSLQPGCEPLTTAIWNLILTPSLNSKQIIQLMCRHHRAVELMMASIQHHTCLIEGAVCDTWNNYLAGRCGFCETEDAHCIEMGYHADRVAKPKRHFNLFLNTTAAEPFCP